MNLPLVFLAGPYTNPDPCENTHAAVAIADRLLDVCVPHIPHLTHFWHTMSPKPYEEWLALDKEYVRRCDAVYRFGGASTGADGEVALALSLGKPVFRSENYLRWWIEEKWTP